MPTPKQIDGRVWRRRKADALRHLGQIAEEAKLISDASRNGDPRATAIVTAALAAAVAITELNDIAVDEVRRLQDELEQLQEQVEKDRPPSAR